MSNRRITIIRIIMIAIPIIVFGWLFSRDFVFSGELIARYSFDKPSPFISPLWPPGRLSDITDSEGDSVQQIFADPVTLRVTLPRRFSDATIMVRHRAPEDQPIRIGLKTAPDVWQWDIREFDGAFLEDGWTIGSVHFRNIAAYAGAGEQLDLIISAPGVAENQNEIMVTDILVRATRDPLTFSNAWQRTAEYLGRKL
jgi:hypothetical protein